MFPDSNITSKCILTRQKTFSVASWIFDPDERNATVVMNPFFFREQRNNYSGQQNIDQTQHQIIWLTAKNIDIPRIHLEEPSVITVCCNFFQQSNYFKEHMHRISNSNVISSGYEYKSWLRKWPDQFSEIEIMQPTWFKSIPSESDKHCQQNAITNMFASVCNNDCSHKWSPCFITLNNMHVINAVVIFAPTQHELNDGSTKDVHVWREDEFQSWCIHNFSYNTHSSISNNISNNLETIKKAECEEKRERLKSRRMFAQIEDEIVDRWLQNNWCTVGYFPPMGMMTRMRVWRKGCSGGFARKTGKKIASESWRRKTELMPYWKC